MPKYRFRWTEIDYLQIDIEAESMDEADMKFSAHDFDTPDIVDTEFGDGPYITELEN